MTYNKTYKQAAVTKGLDYFSYQNIQLNDYLSNNENNIQNYQIVSKLGKGKYSQVFKAYDIQKQRFVAIKILKPVRQGKVKRQLKILNDLKDNSNILNIEGFIEDPCSQRYCLITQYIPAQNTMDILLKLSQDNLRKIFYQILKAINNFHSKGIIHRDIKPQNIIIQKHKQQYLVKIIDFGLAQYYLPGKQYNTKVSARNYKAPQLFLNNKYYDYSLDMWSFGLIFAAAIFRKQVFLKGNNPNDFFTKVIQFVGTGCIQKYIHKQKLKPSHEINQILRQKIRPKVSLTDLVSEQNWQYANDQALDLLSKLLIVDHTERIPVYQALNHPYFEDIQNMLDNVQQ